MIFDFNVKITVTDAPVSIELNKELVEIEEGGEVMKTYSQQSLLARTDLSIDFAFSGNFF